MRVIFRRVLLMANKRESSLLRDQRTCDLSVGFWEAPGYVATADSYIVDAMGTRIASLETQLQNDIKQQKPQT